MTSDALKRLRTGLQELDELEALVQLKTSGQKGPHGGISAARRAALVLLNSHFEAYLEDLLQEALLAINTGFDASKLRRDFTTPRADNIDKLFLLLGISKISRLPKWQKASNKSVRAAIDQLQDRRNAIAHGEKGATVKKREITRFTGYVNKFAESVDDVVRDRIASMTGKKPW